VKQTGAEPVQSPLRAWQIRSVPQRFFGRPWWDRQRRDFDGAAKVMAGSIPAPGNWLLGKNAGVGTHGKMIVGCYGRSRRLHQSLAQDA